MSNLFEDHVNGLDIGEELPLDAFEEHLWIATWDGWARWCRSCRRPFITRNWRALYCVECETEAGE